MARALKMFLLSEPAVRRNVFVDSDDLSQLDDLFGYVRNSVEILVVLCSRDVLSRPWCMGEIATAALNKVRIVRVMLPNFSLPTQEIIDNFGEMTSMNMLSEYGIQPVHIKEALVHFCSTPAIDLLQSITGRALQDVVRELLGRCCSRIKTASNATVAGGQALATRRSAVPSIIILADTGDVEAATAAVVISKMLAPFMADTRRLVTVLELTMGMPADVGKVVLVCTNGVLKVPTVMKSLLEASATAHIEPVVCEAAFRFPSSESLKEVKVEVERLDIHIDGQVYVDLLVGIFKNIAVEINPQASEDVLMVGILRLVKRLNADVRLKLHPTSMDATAVVRTSV